MDESNSNVSDVESNILTPHGDSIQDLAEILVQISMSTGLMNFDSSSSLRLIAKQVWHSERALLLFVQDVLKSQINTTTVLLPQLEEASKLVATMLKDYDE